MSRICCLLLLLLLGAGCQVNSGPETPDDAAVAADDQLFDEFSGVWRGASSGTLLYLVREGRRLRLYLPEGEVPVTMGSIDVGQSTVNLTLPGGRKELVWTLSQVTDKEQGTYHLMITVHDGRQQEFSFVREVSEEDMRGLGKLGDAEGMTGLLAALVVGDEWVGPSIDDEVDPMDEAAAAADSVDPDASEASDALADEEIPMDAAPEQAPSFDCTKALNPAETLVCNAPEVAELDRHLSRAYRLALSRSDQPEAERAIQMRWLAERRNTCDDTACLRKAYRQRLKYFEGAPHYAYSEHAE